MKDPIEHLFGKPPKRGYKFNGVHVETFLKGTGVIINWSAQGIGFGQLTLYIEKGKVKIDTEAMTKQFCDACMKQAYKELSSKTYIQKLPLLTPGILKYLYEQVEWK